MAEREILYKLKVVAHHENERILKRFLESQRDAHLAVSRAKEQAAERAKDITAKKVKEEGRLREQATQKRIREEEKARQAEERARAKAEAELKRHLDRLTSQWESAQGRIREGRMRMTEGLLASTESVMRLSRGFSMLGVVGEENTRKLIESLVKIQATFDIIVGGAKLWVELGKAVEGYRIATTAAATAEQVQREASIVAIGREIKAENALTAARMRSAAAATASGNARITAAAVGSSAAAGQAAETTGGAAAGAAGAGAVGGGAGVFGIGATVAAWAAAIAAVTADLWLLGEAITGQADKQDSLTNTIAETEVAVATFFADFLPRSFRNFFAQLPRTFDPIIELLQAGSALSLSNEEVARAESNQRARIAMRTRRELLAQARTPGMFTGRRQQERLADVRQRFARTPQEQLAAIRAAQAASAADFAATTQAVGQAGTEAERAALLAEQGRIAERQATLAESRLQVEKQILSEQRQAIRERITAATQELDLTRQRIKMEQDRLTSAAERFANLDPLQRSRAIAAMRQAQQRGAASLTREQRQLLQSIGTRRAGRFARESALSEAQRAGFFDVFGAEERQNIQAGRQQERRLQLDVQFQRNLEVKIDMQEDALAKATADFVANRLQRTFAALEAKLQAEIDRKVEEINRMRQQELLQRSNLAGAR